MGLRGDPEAMREYKRNWVAARRRAFFVGKSCVECGSTDALELDHINPETKVHHAIWSWSEPRRLAEIAKCQVLCAACHLEKTIRQMPQTNGFTPYRHGTRAMHRRGCKCGLCMLYERNRKRTSRARTAAAA